MARTGAGEIAGRLRVYIRQRLLRMRLGASVLLTLLLGLAGCAPEGAEQDYQTYTARLARTLDVETGPLPQFELPRAPRPGALQLAVTRDGLDALDFLALHGCALQVTIGKRNSSLGRLAPPSQALLLDLEFLRLAPACIDRLQAQQETELAALLRRAAEHKRSELPRRVFNATLGAEEFQSFWQARGNAEDYPFTTSSAVVEALDRLNALAARWLSGDFRADNADFERLLGQVARGDGGLLLASLRAQRAWLALGDDMLLRRQRRGPLCTEALRLPEADILKNVVRRFFVGGIQPRAAALGSRAHQLLPPVRALERRLDQVLPDEYSAWQRRRDAFLATSLAAPQQHVERIQTSLDQCGELVAR